VQLKDANALELVEPEQVLGLGVVIGIAHCANPSDSDSASVSSATDTNAVSAISARVGT